MSKASVLVVSGEPTIAQDVQQCLLGLGYAITTCTEAGAAAVDLADASRPDAVLMNLQPAGSGDSCDTGRRITELGIPVIYLSDCHNSDAVHRATDADASGFVSLPGDCPRLGATLEVALHRAQMEKHLRKSEAHFRHIFECSPIGMALVDVEGTMLLVNMAFAALVGLQPEDLQGQRHSSLGDTVARPERSHLDDLLLGRRAAVQFEMSYRQASGEAPLWVLVHVALMHDSEEPPCFLYQVLDLSERHATELRLEQIAQRDHLTGLYNRHFLDAELLRAINYSRRYGEALALAFVDLDNFKHVNDSLGHEAGDEVLCAVARRLQAALRDSDCITRHGGDEFVLVLHRLETDEHISAITEKLLRAVAEPITIQGQQFSVGASIGVSRFPADGDDPRSLLRCADQALMQAKTSGRGQVCFFKTGTTAAVPETH